MIHIVRNGKVVMSKSDIDKQIEEFIKAEEIKRLKQLTAMRDLHDNSAKNRVKKMEK